MPNLLTFIPIAGQLELIGLQWKPEIGDEITVREAPEQVSILVDPNGMTPTMLRSMYMWLPSVEQLVDQLEARRAILFHAGFELSTSEVYYKTVVQCNTKHIESKGDTLRSSLGIALKQVILSSESKLH